MYKTKILATDQKKYPNLRIFLQTLSQSQVKDCCSSAIFNRAKDYVAAGKIVEPAYLGENRLTATIAGRENYQTSLTYEHGAVFAHCDCPYDDETCKHTAALLLFASERASRIETIEPIEKEDIKKSLATLHKDELIDIVVEKMNQETLEAIHLHFAPASEQHLFFGKTARAVNRLFCSPKVMQNPYVFEDRLMALLAAIEPLWDKKSGETGDLLLDIMTKTETAITEGYLYKEDYFNEHCYDASNFCEYVVRFVKALPGEMKLYFVRKLKKLLGEMKIGVFAPIEKKYAEMFGKEELLMLKKDYFDLIDQSNWHNEEELFKAIAPVLSFEEKQQILEKTFFRSEFLTLQLIEIFKSKDDNESAMKYMKAFIEMNRNRTRISETIFKEFIATAALNNGQMSWIAEEALHRFPSAGMLGYLAHFYPTKLYQFEDILREQNPDELLVFLEQTNRIDEALQLTHSSPLSDETVQGFFLRNRKTFPAEAAKHVSLRIRKLLEKSGSRLNDSVGELLKTLKDTDKEAFDKTASEIRQKHWQKRNLIANLASM